MSKRTLLIIIAMLLVLDVLSFVTYVVTNSNRPLTFGMGKSPAVVVADTIPDVIISDEFDTLARHVSYAALGGNDPATCTIRLKVVWPTKVNGESRLPLLHHALLSLMDGATGDNITAAVNKMTETPLFANAATYRRISPLGDEAISVSTANFVQCRVYPIFTSHRMLEMAILNERKLNGTTTRNLHAVHYDRLHHKVLSTSDIFLTDYFDDVLAFVNRGIEQLKASGKFPDMHESDSLPGDFLLTKTSVVFYFPDGTISPVGKGMHEVPVSNIELRPYFTDYYNEILNNDSHYLNYGFLTW